MKMSPDLLTQSHPGGKETACVAGYFALLTLIFSWPVVVSGESFYAFDILNQFLPWGASASSPAGNMLISDPLAHILTGNQLLHEGLSSGHIPYWNTWLFAGVPFEPTTYPVQIALLNFLDPVQAHDINLILHLFGAGVFFYWWARMRGIMVYAAVFGGTAWMFNGYLMVWFEWEFVTVNAAILPLVLVAIDKCHKKNDWSRIGFLALALALLINVGFYQLTVYCALFIATYIIYLHFSTNLKTTRSLSVSLMPAVCATSIAIILCLPYFIPKVDTLLWGAEIQRLHFTYAQLITIVSQLKGAHLLLFLFPDLFSNPAGPLVLPFPGSGDYLYNNFNELCLYCGAPLAVILSSAWVFRGDSDVRFFGIMAFILLLMLAGTYVYYPIYLLPGLDLTTPNRLLFIFGFCVCALATTLFHRLYSVGKHEVKALTVSLIVVLAIVSLLGVLLLTGILLPYIYPALNTVDISQLHGTLLASAEVVTTPFLIILITSGLLVLGAYNPSWRRFTSPLLILILAADLLYFGSGYNTKSRIDQEAPGLPPAPMVQFLQDQPGVFRTGSYHSYFLHNYLQTFHLEDIAGYLSVYPKSYAEFIQLSQPHHGFMPAAFSRWLNLEHLGHPLLSMAGMRYFVAPAGANLGHPDFKEVYSNEVAIFENIKAFDRAYFVCNADYITDSNDMFTRLANADLDTLKTTVLISGSGAAVRNSDCRSAVSVSRFPNGDLTITLASAQDGFLVIANQFDRHWRLDSSGESWPILRANHTFMASPQPSGHRQLQLSYQPLWHMRSYEWSIILWLAIVFFLAGRGLYRLMR